tara:strand:+ start:193 stop:861 length:669 start_codon:yes stop_codon:yes gene_type:complete
MDDRKRGLPKIYSKVVGEKGERISTELESPDQVHIDVYDAENPYSVINMCPSIMINPIYSIPEELQEMNNEELRKLVNPDSTLNQIRLRFWHEYDECVFSGKKAMTMSRVLKGICQPDQFKKILKEHEKLAYILCPVKSYEIQVQDFLETSLFKMRQGLDRIQIESSKDLLAVLKVYEVFDKRVNGDYKQTVNKKVTVENKQVGNSAEIRNQIGAKKDLLIE